MSGRDDLVRRLADAPLDAIRADIAERREALAHAARGGRLAAIWRDDRAELEP